MNSLINNKRSMIYFNGIIYIILLFNMFWIMYPDQLAGADVIELLAHAAVRYINPIALTFAVLIFYIKCDKVRNKFYILSAMLASAVMIVSSYNAKSFKSFLLAIFFFVAALAIMYVRDMDSKKFLNIFNALLGLWVTVPVLLLVNPDWWSLFVSFPENSFHGFADNRVLYGLWSAPVAIICIAQRLKHDGQYIAKFDWQKNILCSLVFIGIYFSQSRGAVVAIALACMYYIFGLDKALWKKFILWLVVLLIVAGVLLSWKIFGRHEPFEFVNSTRQEIALKYIDNIVAEKSWFGAGEQVDVVINGHAVQAHNFFIQWVANWGWIGLVSFLIYSLSLWRLCDSLVGRMLLLVFFVFSLTQPIQGTANFFGPVTLSFLLYVAMAESVYRRAESIRLLFYDCVD